MSSPSDSPPPPSDSGSGSESPPPSDSSPPPPSDSSPPPDASPPPPSDPSPPPPDSSSPPPDSSPPPPDASPPPTPDASPPPTPPDSSSSPSPPKTSSSPPPKTSSSPPPPKESKSSSPPAPPPPLSPPPPPSPPPPRGSSRHSPPPPRSIRSPPDSRSSDSSSGNSTPQAVPIIVGVAVAAGFLLFAMALIFFVCSRKKKKRDSNSMYYDDRPGPKGGNPYYNGSNQNWNNNREHYVNMAPLAAGGQGGVWPSPPPPPQQGLLSSDLSSSNFSGPRGPPLPPPHPTVALGFNKSTFTFDELLTATGGFSPANLLGQGGFGYVHKGVLPNGKEIAVKSLKSGSGQGDREFAAEVEIISRVHHRHLVSLVGYCIAGDKKMLVYEYVPNNNLDFHLHGVGRPPMDWSSRIKIALGAAKGLAYLHEDCHPRIIHRDIKTPNILIDMSFEAKVADFGLAKLNQDNFTHVSTRVMGTFGYLAPEYASSGKLTEKSDVFSFGIMLLELITGRRPVDPAGEHMEDSLVDWSRPLCLKAMGDRNYEALADPRLERKYDAQEMACMVACAGACIRHSARRRPKMSQVVRALEGDVSLEDLNDGVKPGQSTVFGSNTSSEYDASSYSADMRRFRKVAFDSQEYTSSEYGLNPSSTSSDNSRKPSQLSSPIPPRPLSSPTLPNNP